jgi:hypothetical protein
MKSEGAMLMKHNCVTLKLGLPALNGPGSVNVQKTREY